MVECLCVVNRIDLVLEVEIDKPKASEKQEIMWIFCKIFD